MFGLDRRSLALFRIFVSFLGMLDLLDRAQDLKAHYTDYGLLPRSLAIDVLNNPYCLSFYFIGGTIFFIRIAFFFHFLLYLSFMVGWHTRTTSILLYFMITSLFARNPLVLLGGDFVFSNLLFLCIFLPMDCYSLDNYFKTTSQIQTGKISKDKKKGKAHSWYILNLATLAAHTQICLIYVSSFFKKTGGRWWDEWSAGWYALNRDYLRTDLGEISLQFPILLELGSFGTLVWELIGVSFFFVPEYTSQIRLIALFLFGMMHFVFGTTMRLGIFGPMTLIALLMFIPSYFWDEIIFRHLTSKERTNMKIFYRNDIPYSKKAFFPFHKFLHLFYQFFLLPETQIYWYTEEDNPSPSASNWLVIVDYKRKTYLNFEALLYLFYISPLTYPFYYIFLYKFAFFRRILYKIFSFLDIIPSPKLLSSSPIKISHQELPVAEAYKDSKYSLYEWLELLGKICNALFMIFWIGLILVLGIQSVVSNFYPIPQSIAPYVDMVITTTQVQQDWGMFSPDPPNSTFWYVFEAELDDGTQFEFFRNGGLYDFQPSPLDWGPPPSRFSGIRNHRWYKYFEVGFNFHKDKNKVHDMFGKWICLEFNSRRSGKERLWKTNYYLMSQEANYTSLSKEPYTQTLLFGITCFSKE